MKDELESVSSEPNAETISALPPSFPQRTRAAAFQSGAGAAVIATGKANMTKQPYWIWQMLGAEKRAKTFREKAKISRDPKWYIAMAKGAELDASRCFKRWRSQNPQAPHPIMELQRQSVDAEFRGKAVAS